jgi:hypothetical protein
MSSTPSCPSFHWTLGSHTMIAFVPIFGIVRIAKTLKNSTDYSFQNMARHVLFLLTNRECRWPAWLCTSA